MAGDTLLLTQLPLGRLPEHVRNLRHTLLARTGMSVTEESYTIQDLKLAISQRLPNIFPVKDSNKVFTELPQLNLTWAVKSEVSIWIRQGVVKHLRDTTR